MIFLSYYIPQQLLLLGNFFDYLRLAFFENLCKNTLTMTFAIIKTGGKQYKVSEGDVITVEKMGEELKGKKVVFEEVLLIDREGDVKIGTPMITGAKVSGEVVDEGLGKKISIVHYKAKIRHKKISGHRQPFTKVKIESIT